MILDPLEIQKIGEVIQKHKSFLLISHRSPDGDTVGSALAFYHALTKMGKAVSLSCYDLMPEVFRFMPGIEKFQRGLPDLSPFEAVIILDVGATHLTGYHESHPQLFSKQMEVVNIDHHQSNNFFGKYNLVDPNAASATMVVYALFEALDIEIDRNVATCLLTGLYTDTGSFMHSNTSAETLRVGARLVAKGANLRGISKEIFRTTKISTMHLWGRVMRNVTLTSDKVAMSVLTENDFKETGASYDEMTGAVDYVNSVPGSDYSVILTERGGRVKGSLRTLNDEVNVAEIAAQYGGGGHIKAAGFALEGKLEKEVRWKVVGEE